MIQKRLKGNIGRTKEMAPKDLRYVLEIERQSASDQSNGQNGGVIPWDQEWFLYYMENYRSHDCAVFLHDDEIIAFAVAQKSPCDQHLIMLNMAVHRNWRRLRVGSKIMDWAKTKSNNLAICVRESNQRGWKFLRSQKERVSNLTTKLSWHEYKIPDPEDRKQAIAVEDGFLFRFQFELPQLNKMNRMKMFY